MEYVLFAACSDKIAIFQAGYPHTPLTPTAMEVMACWTVAGCCITRVFCPSFLRQTRITAMINTNNEMPPTTPPIIALHADTLLPSSSSSHHYHLSLNRGGRWGTTDDFTICFLHFSLFSAALWDLANSRPFQSLMLSSHLFLCLPCLLPPFTVPCKMVFARPGEKET